MRMQHDNTRKYNPDTALEAACSIAADQGDAIVEDLAKGMEWLGLDQVQTREFRIVQTDARGKLASFSAPPLVLDPNGAFSRPMLDEINFRLICVMIIECLIGNSRDPGDILAAIWFAKDSRRAFRAMDPLVAEPDFLAWRALQGDLSAWFDFRFAISRQHMA
jgi:hypothetical protein